MTDKEKIRAYIERQITLLDKNNIDNPVLGVSAGIVMSELKHLLSFIDNLQEEPESEDLAMEVFYETEWDDIYKFLRKNLNGEKVKLVIIKE